MSLQLLSQCCFLNEYDFQSPGQTCTPGRGSYVNRGQFLQFYYSWLRVVISGECEQTIIIIIMQWCFGSVRFPGISELLNFCLHQSSRRLHLRNFKNALRRHYTELGAEREIIEKVIITVQRKFRFSSATVSVWKSSKSYVNSVLSAC